MVYRFIDDNKKEFGFRWLLRRIGISSNSNYNYLKDNKREYREKREEICNEIKTYFNCGRLVGHRGMVVLLARKGIKISKTTLHKYMNQYLNMHSIVFRKKYRYVCGEKNKVFPNLLVQDFRVEAKNKVWCTDFTYRYSYYCTRGTLYIGFTHRMK